MKIIYGSKKSIPTKLYDGMLNLRYRAYIEQGFIKPNKEEKFGDNYDKSAIHFLAIERDKVIGCLSIIFGKLPLESIFYKEKKELVKKFRAKKAVEFSRLAVEKNYRIGKRRFEDYDNFVSLRIFRKAYLYLLRKRIPLFLIVVNPKYVKRYEKSNFKKYGKEKAYPLVINNPAILMYQTKKMFLQLLFRRFNNLKFLILPKKG